MKSRKISKKVFSILCLVLVLSSFTALPVFAATYEVKVWGWKFEMVDGSRNGKFYDLTSGQAEINVMSTIVQKPMEAAGTMSYTTQLFKKNLLIDTSLGSKGHTATVNGYSNRSQWNVSSSGKYYLVMSKSDSTIYELEVSGTLTN